MTEAEKLAKFLEDCGDMHSAALIRSLDAQNKRMAEALRDASQNSLHILRILKMHHADALRDAGVAP